MRHLFIALIAAVMTAYGVEPEGNGIRPEKAAFGLESRAGISMAFGDAENQG